MTNTEERSLIEDETSHQKEDNTQNREDIDRDNYKYEDRLQVPYIEKEKGDKALKNNNYDQALKHYSKVSLGMKILVEDKAIESDEELTKYVTQVSIPTFLNMSFIHFKQGDWESVVRTTSKVLDFDKKNIKALYRRCMALNNMGRIEEGESDMHILKIELKGTKELDNLILNQSNALKKRENDKRSFYSRVSKRYLANSKEEMTRKEKILNYITVYIPHRISKTCSWITNCALYPIKKLGSVCKKKKD